MRFSHSKVTVTLWGCILYYAFCWFHIIIFQFDCRENGGTCKLGRLAWSRTLIVNNGGGRQAQVWLQGSGLPELRSLSSSQAGHSKAGVKMEMTGGKYALVDAKINYKTFTFKMRSWNGCKRESTHREEGAGQTLNRETRSLKGIFEKGLLGALLCPFFLWEGGLVFIRTSDIPIFQTNGKTVFIPNQKVFLPLWIIHIGTLCMNPKTMGVAIIPEVGPLFYHLVGAGTWSHGFFF